MTVATKSESTSAKLVGREVRCKNKVLKKYPGGTQLRVCNSLLAVVELNIEGAGSVIIHTKCMKRNCQNMVHHQISK